MRPLLNEGTLMRRTIVAVASLLPAQALAASPTILNPMFQDHAVLQRDVPIPVYGHATPNSDVFVSIDRESRVAHADGQGRWRVTMPPMQAGGPYVMRARSSAGDSQIVKDVLVGDVFLCGGNPTCSLRSASLAMRRLKSRRRETAKFGP
jgi:sialate O-acetylesterase